MALEGPVIAGLRWAPARYLLAIVQNLLALITPMNPYASQDPDDADDLAERLHQSRRETLALMSYEERLTGFLDQCNRRGSPYVPTRHSLPNLSRLAKYCGCSCSTLLRIATGETCKPSRKLLTILNAIACICPPPYGVDLQKEQSARIADANRWLRHHGPNDFDIWASLREGIKRRMLKANEYRPTTRSKAAT